MDKAMIFIKKASSRSVFKKFRFQFRFIQSLLTILPFVPLICFIAGYKK